MPTTPKTYGSLNPLLNTPKVTTPAVSGVPVNQPTRPVATTPTVTAPVNTRQSQIDSITAQANAIKAQIPTATGLTPSTTYGADLPTYSATDEMDTALSTLASKAKADMDMTVSPEKTFQNKLKMYQAEIDAVNQIYREKINQSRIEGQGRLGTGRAIQGRSGLLGSDFASAQNDTITQNNNELTSGIQAEQLAKIAAIEGLARKDAADEIAAQNLAKQNGGESYLKFLGEKSTRRSSKLDSFISSIGDTDISTISPTNLAEVAKSYGLSADELKTKVKEAQKDAATAAKEADLKTKKSEADIAKINADIASGKLINLGEGNKLYNTETGEVVAYNPKTYAPQQQQTTFGGYSEDQNKVISSIDDKVSKNGTYVKTSNMRGYVDNVNASLSQATGTGDLAAINQFQKVIDEGAVTRDQDVKLIQGSQSLANRLATQVSKLQNGQQLSPALRSEMKTAVNQLYEAQVKALAKDPFITSKKSQLDRYGIKPEDTIIGELGAFNSQQNQNVIPTGDPEYNAYIKAITQ